MYVVTANVRYRPSGPLVPSFLAFDTALDMFVWDDEGAEFFDNYQEAWEDAWAFTSIYYSEVKDVKVKEIKILDIS